MEQVGFGRVWWAWVGESEDLVGPVAGLWWRGCAQMGVRITWNHPVKYHALWPSSSSFRSATWAQLHVFSFWLKKRALFASDSDPSARRSV